MSSHSETSTKIKSCENPEFPSHERKHFFDHFTWSLLAQGRVRTRVSVESRLSSRHGRSNHWATMTAAPAAARSLNGRIMVKEGIRLHLPWVHFRQSRTFWWQRLASGSADVAGTSIEFRSSCHVRVWVACDVPQCGRGLCQWAAGAPSAKWGVHILHIKIMLAYLAYNCIFFAYFCIFSHRRHSHGAVGHCI